MDDADNMAQLADLAVHPEQWPTADVRALTTLALAAFMRLGTDDDATQPHAPAHLAYLRHLYACVVQRASVEDRGHLLNRIGEALHTAPGAAPAFLIIAMQETEHKLIASAALDYALYLPLQDSDSLTGPRSLREMAAHPECPPHTRAGLLSGLLWLGDRRTLPLLDRCWELLPNQSLANLAFAHSGYIYASTVQFLLDWLAASAAAGDAQQFAITSAGLQLAGNAAQQVLDIERRFPVWHDDGTPPVRVVQQWSRAHYGRLIEARLRHLRTHGPQPNMLHLALSAWNLSPLA